MPGPIIPSSGSSGVTVHANLTGLSADDHPQYLKETLADAKGDLIAASANDTWAKLSVGTDGQVLTADAASASGVKWATGGVSAPLTLTVDDAVNNAATTVMTLNHTTSGTAAVGIATDLVFGVEKADGSIQTLTIRAYGDPTGTDPTFRFLNPSGGTMFSISNGGGGGKVSFVDGSYYYPYEGFYLFGKSFASNNSLYGATQAVVDGPIAVKASGVVQFQIAADGKICTNQKIAASVGVGAIADKLPVYDVDGTTLLGYIPVYATIT